jgi:uncharacterized membrane-anchored protein YhcB (DUF1043 family)
MSVLVSILIFIIGAGAGFVLNQLLSRSTQESNQLAAQASQSEATLAQYKQDVAEHLDSSTQLLQQMNKTCKSAMLQMEQSTQLLQQATPSVETMPFFSEETQEQLAKTVHLRHKKTAKKDVETIAEPPLDYSGHSSGLFTDNIKKEESVN